MGSLIRHRFAKDADPFAEAFVASARDDEKLVHFDILGSIAHAKALRKAELITLKEERQLLQALAKLSKDYVLGKWAPTVKDEDVHMAVEKRLGKIGAKLHAGRSRNDQVALDIRLWTRDQIVSLSVQLAKLRRTIVQKALRHQETIIPGYTHMQRAQPMLLAQILLSFHEMIARDGERLVDCRKRVNISPLGAAALAGTSLPIDPKVAARELGFREVYANSIDAVSDRDFVVEFVSACALLQTHLSQIAENLILWSSAEFGFIELPDELCTSSSIMPQKKNADMLELVRAKTGRVTGALMNLLTILKALPTGYNRDLQETKPPLFDAAEAVTHSVTAILMAIRDMNVNDKAMEAAAQDEGLIATDLAEYLVEKGVPFRDAHTAVARLMKKGVSIRRFSLAQFQKFSPSFEADVMPRLSPYESVRRRGAAEVRRRLRRLSQNS